MTTDQRPSEDELAAVAAAVVLVAGRRAAGPAGPPDAGPLHAWRLARLAALGRRPSASG